MVAWGERRESAQEWREYSVRKRWSQWQGMNLQEVLVVSAMVVEVIKEKEEQRQVEMQKYFEELEAF